MNRKETGHRYEEKAAAYLEQKGFLLIQKNFRCRQGEIDLIGLHEGCLVFVEVKYRKNSAAGAPEEAVGRAKQMKICRTSDYYRVLHPRERAMQVRYDVVAICGESVTWHRNAFFYCRKREHGMSW